MTTLRLGTRPSDLAVAQAERVAELLRQATDDEIELVEIESQGDRNPEERFEDFEGVGFFSSALEVALLDGEVDAAVHSLKDLTTERPEGLTVAAIPERGDPRDVLVIPMSAIENMQIDPLYPVANFPEGCFLGTSSVRRRAQARNLGTEAELRDVRGNIPTRLEKLRDNAYTGLLLAKVGLDRLGLDLEDPSGELHAIPFEIGHFVPAPGQGALAVETRADTEAEEIVAEIDDPEVRAEVETERELLSRLEGGCSVPLGVFVQKRDAAQWRMVLFAHESHQKIAATVHEELTAPTRDKLLQKAWRKMTMAELE